MNTDTPRTNQAVFQSDGQWSFVLRGCSQQLERELTAVTEQRDEWANLWAELSRSCVKDLAKVEREVVTLTEQRDKLAEVLRKIKNEGGRFNDPYDELDFIDGITYEALQSLTPNEP